MRSPCQLLTALLVAAVVGCGPSAQPPVPATSPVTKPDYEPQPNEVYLRKELPPVIAEDTSSLTVEFPIKNAGTTPLTFTNVRKTCSCSEAELGRISLAPGEQTTLTMSVRTPGRFGQQRFTCYLDESAGKSWVCDLHVAIYQRWRFDPYLTHFGMVKPRSEQTRTVSFLCAASREDELPNAVEFASDSTAVTFGAVQQSVERPATGLVVKRFQLPVVLKVPSAFGTGSATVTAKGVTDGREFRHTTTVDWHAVETHLAAPQQVFFSAVEAEKGTASKRVVLRRRDGDPIPKVTVKAPHPAVVVDVATEGNLATLTVNLDARKADGFTFGEVIVTTGDSDQPTVTIPVAVGR